MKILIDTNVILDVLSKREPHFHYSSEVLKLCGGQVTGCIAIFQIRDIFYLLCRMGVDKTIAKSSVKHLSDSLVTLDTNDIDISYAFASNVSDFEDALLIGCAVRHDVDFIITRNIKDFALSPIRAVSPQGFIENGCV